MHPHNAIVINSSFLVAAVLIAIGELILGGCIVLAILKSCHDADLLP